MHEISLAMNVLEIVKETAQKNHLKNISMITMEKGELSGVLEESFIYAFGVISKDTIAAHAKIDILHSQATAVCKRCDKEFMITHVHKICPICNRSDEIEYTTSQFYIKSIEGDTYEN